MGGRRLAGSTVSLGRGKDVQAGLVCPSTVRGELLHGVQSLLPRSSPNPSSRPSRAAPDETRSPGRRTPIDGLSERAPVR